MNDNFSGIDTEGGRGHAVMIFSFLKDRSSLQYCITQRMGQSSMFLTFPTICNFRGRIWALGSAELQGLH